jgi:hypothetical protein
MKGGIVDPEKTSIVRQRHSKHVSAVTNNNARENVGSGVFHAIYA